MGSLHQVLTRRREELLQRWTDEVRRLAPSPAMPRAVLIDHVPRFLEELASQLRSAEAARKDDTIASSAAEHGEQRFQLGFAIESVAREYGILQRCIFELADEAGVAITLDEQRILVDAIHEGIVDAVGQYSLQRDAELARQANEHFAFVAHELRNPLTSAELALSSLVKKGVLPPDRTTKLLTSGLLRARQLVDNTLSLMLAGQARDLQLRPVKLAELAEDAVHEAEPAAHDRNVTIALDPSPDIEIELDERLMRSAITNLVGNAVKFTHDGSSVRIRWQTDEASVRLEIEDGCGGLPDGAVDQMFTPFVQVGENRKGFGLGLAIARQAVQAHGGSIDVRNRPGDGCTFVIELPASSILHSSL
jgi:signal transduction histidine kinase